MQRCRVRGITATFNGLIRNGSRRPSSISIPNPTPCLTFGTRGNEVHTQAISSASKKSVSYGGYTLNSRRFGSQDLPKHLVLSMPALSPTMTEGNIGTWKKKIGDKINTGDVLCEIETDKATMDFECQEEGYLAKILIQGGEKNIPVNKPLCVIIENASDLDKFTSFGISENTPPTQTAPQSSLPKETTPPPKESSSSQKVTVSKSPENVDTRKPSSEPGRIFASPLARKVADEVGVSLREIKGTGPNGRIVNADVMASVSTLKGKSLPSGDSFTDLPLSNMRKIIASRLLESKQTIPHYYLSLDICMDKLLELKNSLNSKSKDDAYKLSLNDFVIKATALACKKVPEVNSSWMGEFIRQYTNVDVCVAVATENGLMTPIVPAAEQMGLLAISNLVKELAQNARLGKLAPHQYQGGTFTISSLGMFGVKNFCAIINPPQSCILAVGTLEKRLVPNEENGKGYATASYISVTLSCDHRVVDGAVGAKWLMHFKNLLEEPITMLL